MSSDEKRQNKKTAGEGAKRIFPVDKSSPMSTEQEQTLSIQQAINLGIQHHQAGDLPKAEGIYQQILRADPNQPIVLHLHGMIAHQAGNNDIAFDLISKALNIEPDYAEAHYNLALVLHALGKTGEAVESFRKAIAIKPDYVKALYNLGNALQGLGELDDAVTSYNKAITIKPDYAEAHFKLGNALQGLGKLDESMISYNKAITIKPNYAEAHYNLGIVLQALRKLNDAVISYNEAIAIKPDYAAAHSNLGKTLKKIGKLDEALESFNKAIAIEPDNAEAHYNFGHILQELERHDEAMVSFNKAIDIKPDYPEAHSNLGNAFYKLGQIDEALASFNKAIAINPDFAEAYNNLGNALKGLGSLDEAMTIFNKALQLKPDYAHAYYNTGATFQELGKLNEAIANYDKAISIKPDYAAAYWNKSLAFLICGEFKNGWELYEWRWETGQSVRRHHKFKQPYVDGIKLKNETIVNKSRLRSIKLLVWMEQGVGDEIMFASLLTDLAQNVGSIVVECEERLQPIFQRSYPEIKFIPCMDPPSLKLDDDEIDYQISAGDLGYFLRSDLNSFSIQKSYLCPDPTKRDQIRSEYIQKWPSKLLVGISWRSVNAIYGANRNLSLDQWEPLISNVDCNFISLQYGEVEDELLALNENTGLKVFNDTNIDQLTDMDTFAAQVAALDIIISIDNSTVHMAGALGVPTWVLLPYAPDWRWLLNREDSPWYGSIKLYRQCEDRKWGPVLQRCVNDLINLTH